MAYHIYSFGTVVFPEYDPETDISTPEADIQTVFLPGGGIFDLWGEDQAEGKIVTIYKRFGIEAETEGEVDTLFDSYRALVGKKDWLTRIHLDGTTERVRARCRVIRGLRRPGQAGYLPITIEFDQLEPAWHGTQYSDSWTLDSGEYLDTGLLLDAGADLQWSFTSGVLSENFTLGGNARPLNVKVRINVQGNPMTTCTVTLRPQDSSQPVAKWTFSGSVNQTKDLIVDCGALTVKNDGVDAYDDFDFHADHGVDRWHNLIAGDCTVEATQTGGSDATTLTLTLSEAWV